MFNKLMELAQQGDLTLAVRAVPNDKTLLTVIVAPLPKDGQDPALSQPIRMTGTVDELQANFGPAMDRFIGARESLTEQLDATLAILEEAKKTAAKKGTDALKGKGKGASGTSAAATATASVGSPTTGFDEDTGEELDADPAPAQSSAAPSTPTAPAPAAASVGNLFG